MIPTDFHIFQGGSYTTNSKNFAPLPKLHNFLLRPPEAQVDPFQSAETYLVGEPGAEQGGKTW